MRSLIIYQWKMLKQVSFMFTILSSSLYFFVYLYSLLFMHSIQVIQSSRRMLYIKVSLLSQVLLLLLLSEISLFVNNQSCIKSQNKKENLEDHSGNKSKLGWEKQRKKKKKRGRKMMERKMFERHGKERQARSGQGMYSLSLSLFYDEN